MLSMKAGSIEVELLPLSQRQVLTKRIKRSTQTLHKVHFPSACPWNNSTVLLLCPPGSPPGREHHSHSLYPAGKSLLTATLCILRKHQLNHSRTYTQAALVMK